MRNATRGRVPGGAQEQAGRVPSRQARVTCGRHVRARGPTPRSHRAAGYVAQVGHLIFALSSVFWAGAMSVSEKAGGLRARPGTKCRLPSRQIATVFKRQRNYAQARGA